MPTFVCFHLSTTLSEMISETILKVEIKNHSNVPTFVCFHLSALSEISETILLYGWVFTSLSKDNFCWVNFIAYILRLTDKPRHIWSKKFWFLWCRFNTNWSVSPFVTCSYLKPAFLLLIGRFYRLSEHEYFGSSLKMWALQRIVLRFSS